MIKQQPQPFSIKCQCSAYKHGLLITNKKKSKLSNLILQPKTKSIVIIPLNSKQDKFIFQLKRLKHIHKKFITQGKITIEFTQDIDKSKDIANNNNPINTTQRLSQIFIQAASSQNLQLLIKKIVDIKKQIKPEIKPKIKPQIKPQIKVVSRNQSKNEKEYMTQDEFENAKKQQKSTVNRKKQNFPKLERFAQHIQQRKKDPLKYNESVKRYQQQQKNYVKINRRQLMKRAYQPLQIQRPNVVQQKTLFKPLVDILELPTILLQKILQYTKVELKHRLVNRKFNDFTLKNIKSLIFKDQVDEQTFNKLAKYATNIRGKLKNVRSLELIDVYDQPQLQKNRAKSLFFSEWKQISKKNMLQIKGLRIHTLQMPYQIKFQFQNIYGIKLKQLHLMSKTQVTTPNYLISDQNLMYLFKNVKPLQAFSIPYITSSVLDELTQNLKQKVLQMRELNIGSINENCKKQEKWFLFHSYEKLKILTVQRVLRGGIVRKDIRYAFTFPLYIEQLTIGSIISQQTIHNLPTTLTYLKLSGDQYYNKDISQIYLPYLRQLDISECSLVRPAVINDLQKCNNLKIITNWQRLDYDYWRDTAQQKSIEIISLKGMIMRR